MSGELIVDGMNLIGSRPNRWWEDRGRAMRELIGDLGAYAAQTGRSITVVFDDRPPGLRPGTGGGIKVRFGDGSAQAADLLIADLVAGHPHPETVTVVTSDKPLQRTVQAAGGRVIGAGSFRDRLYDGRGEA